MVYVYNDGWCLKHICNTKDEFIMTRVVYKEYINNPSEY